MVSIFNTFFFFELLTRFTLLAWFAGQGNCVLNQKNTQLAYTEVKTPTSPFGIG